MLEYNRRKQIEIFVLLLLSFLFFGLNTRREVSLLLSLSPKYKISISLLFILYCPCRRDNEVKKLSKSLRRFLFITEVLRCFFILIIDVLESPNTEKGKHFQKEKLNRFYYKLKLEPIKKQDLNMQ